MNPDHVARAYRRITREIRRCRHDGIGQPETMEALAQAMAAGVGASADVLATADALERAARALRRTALD